MTMPTEHQELADQMAREQQTQVRAADATIDNSRSVTAVNHALVKSHEANARLFDAKAALRHRLAGVALWAGAVGVGWSVWAWVHWA